MRNGVVAAIFTAVVLVSQNAYQCDGFRVLGLFPLPIRSHFIFFEKFMKELVNRGHEVHVVSHYPQKRAVSNYYDIDINGSLPQSVGQISIQSKYNRGFFGKARYIFRTCGSEICEYLFKHPSIIELKNSTSLSFDLVVAELYGTDCLLAFAHHFGAPIIGISGTDLLPWAGARMGNPDNPSYIPNYFFATNDQMLLYEKLTVLAALFMTKIGYFFLSTAASENRARDFFGNHIPSLETMVSNTSLLLVNSHLSINTPRPMVPGVIEVGGLHIRPPNPLSWEVDKLVKSSPQGVIYFSMGTVIDLKTFELDTLQKILNAFSKMSQTIILSGVIENATIPSNVYVYPWIEQLDLLSQVQLKVFVTHGGLMSLQEAAYWAIPILGISIFPNHKRNLNKYVNSGAGLVVEYDDLTEDIMVALLNELVTNTSYKENAKKLSKLFTDRPMSALDTAMYWTEYVVKFKGAHHLRSKSAELVWFEYYLVDCILILLVLLTVAILIVAATTYFLQNYMDDVWFYNLTKTAKKEDEQTHVEKTGESDKDK